MPDVSLKAEPGQALDASRQPAPQAAPAGLDAFERAELEAWRAMARCAFGRYLVSPVRRYGKHKGEHLPAEILGQEDLAVLGYVLLRSFPRRQCGAWYRDYKQLGKAVELSKGKAHDALARLEAARVVTRLGEEWSHWLQLNVNWLEWAVMEKPAPAEWHEEQPSLNWDPRLRHLLVENFVATRKTAPQPASGPASDRFTAGTLPDVAAVPPGGARGDNVGAGGPVGPVPQLPSGDTAGEPTRRQTLDSPDELPEWQAKLVALHAEQGWPPPDFARKESLEKVPKKGTFKKTAAEKKFPSPQKTGAAGNFQNPGNDQCSQGEKKFPLTSKGTVPPYAALDRSKAAYTAGTAGRVPQKGTLTTADRVALAMAKLEEMDTSRELSYAPNRAWWSKFARREPGVVLGMLPRVLAEVKAKEQVGRPLALLFRYVRREGL